MRELNNKTKKNNLNEKLWVSYLNIAFICNNSLKINKSFTKNIN